MKQKQLTFMKHLDCSNLPREISLGTDCSGIEAPLMALEMLKISVNHKFSCDNDVEVINSIKANYKPKKIYTDIAARNHAKLPHVDIYVAGFPCQTFSVLGKRAGFNDELKGTIFFDCLSTILHVKPKCFILENVKGLINHDKGRTFRLIIESLNDIGDYDINHHVYNTLDYGLPQNRERVYIIGLHKNHFSKQYEIPKSIPLEINVEDIIDRSIGRNTIYGKITPHKLDVLGDLVKIGKIDSFDEPWCVNLNVSSYKRTSPMKHICPCLLAGNGGDCIYYYTPIRRRLTPREYLRLQGFPESFKQVVKDRFMYKQVGNSMSINVLCAIYINVFKAI